MLKNPQKADLDKDGKLSSYEKKRGKAIEANMKAKRGKFFEEKKEKINLDEIVVKALKDSSNKQMSDKAVSKYIKRKTPAQIREREMVKKSMGGEMRGYGAARTSGMGLQDEELVPGKSLDYYKDLM